MAGDHDRYGQRQAQPELAPERLRIVPRMLVMPAMPRVLVMPAVLPRMPPVLAVPRHPIPTSPLTIYP
uniref:Uncharacterized protein n=1 Tax=Verrucosispora sp. MS100047 TaxID=1410949 RepID=A0A097CSH6_9ACTN|nr:hypothetical protein VASRM7_371 [Verrucosispora sp. MS100047]